MKIVNCYKPLNIFAKEFIIDNWQHSKYVYEIIKRKFLCNVSDISKNFIHMGSAGRHHCNYEYCRMLWLTPVIQLLWGNYHLFMYSRKQSTRDCATKLCDNWMFKALQRIKKSFNSIEYDLPKPILVSLPTHICTAWVNFDWSRNYEITIYLFTVIMY